MKQKDVVLIIVVVFISGVFSSLITKIIISPPKNRQEKVDMVQPISGNINKPSTDYFNSSSIDPTQLIRIGETNNNQPFKAP